MKNNRITDEQKKAFIDSITKVIEAGERFIFTSETRVMECGKLDEILALLMATVDYAIKSGVTKELILLAILNCDKMKKGEEK